MKPTEVPVVLVHGVGLDHTMWLPVTSALRHRRTVVYDMMGHGSAPKLPGPYVLDMFVDQLCDLVDALDTEIDLVGFSMGALVAEGFAVRRGARLRRLVVLNGVHDRSVEERAAILDRVAEVRSGSFANTVEPALQRWFTPAFVVQRPEVVQTIREQLLRNDERAYADSYEVFATADAQLVDRVDRIDVPTLVVTGGDDQRSTPAMARALAAAIPNARAAIMPGLRHLTPVESPHEVARLIDEFTAT